MSTLYMVRCNFDDPEKTAAWEEWYSGEKQDWLLSRPLFRAGQRFGAASSSDGVTFTALYTIDSPDALQTPEYQSGWGWLGWKPNIVDWTRNFFEGVDPETYLTAPGERLMLVFVDRGVDPAAAQEKFSELTWTQAIPGLDRALSAVGIGKSKRDQQVSVSTDLDGVNVGIFDPASPARYAESDARRSASS